MKYYIGEYWAMANSTDPQERARGKTKWTETAKKYGDYFKSVKSMLPKGFLKIFETNNRFHDFRFDSISILDFKKCVSTVLLSISLDDATYEIRFFGVEKMYADIKASNWWLCGELTWSYSEFELNEEGKWILRILCDVESELEIIFKRISISKKKTDT
jgi:hypothetical protein